MATSRKRRKAKAVRAKTRSKAGAKASTAAIPSTGAVTLDEARALARAKQPKLAMRAMRKGAAPALELRSYAGPPRLPLAPGNQRHPHVLLLPQPIFGGRRRSHR